MDVPEGAEIGTDGEGFALLAILGTNVHWLEVGHIPNAEQLYAEAIKLLILERLRRIDAAGGETETGVIMRKALSKSLQTNSTIHRFSTARNPTSE